MKRDADALAVLDRLLVLYPQSHQARAGRAVLLARAGRVEEALRDAEMCLKSQPGPMIRYQLAGVFAHSRERPGHAAVALRLLADALLEGAGWKELPTDPDLKPLGDEENFQQLLSAAKALQTHRR
jgi:predicted Zn-dependent protease